MALQCAPRYLIKCASIAKCPHSEQEAKRVRFHSIYLLKRKLIQADQVDQPGSQISLLNLPLLAR